MLSAILRVAPETGAQFRCVRSATTKMAQIKRINFLIPKIREKSHIKFRRHLRIRLFLKLDARDNRNVYCGIIAQEISDSKRAFSWQITAREVDSPQFLTFGGSDHRAFTARIRLLGRK